MTIKDEKTYNEIEERMEALLALSDILHGRRAINFDVARNIYHNLGVPANVVLG